MKSKFLVLLCFIRSISFAQNNSIVAKMRQKWAGKWPVNIQFEQKVLYYKDDKLIKEDVWQEFLSAPQKLHIRFGGFETGNGAIFKNDSIFYYSKNNIVKKEFKVQHLLLLGFDVYFLKVADTEQKLKNLGFDLSKNHHKIIDGKKIVVVGTKDKNDDTTAQFWIDKKNMYLVRVILKDGNTISDIEFKNYKIIDNYPIATSITFKSNGKLAMTEEYFNISFPKYSDKNIFDLSKFKDVTW